VSLFAVPVRTFILSNLGSRFLFRGEGYDTSSVTISATRYLQYTQLVAIVY
jgi:hypothetical protein